MASLADHFTHLLNIGVDFDLSHHIMYRDKSEATEAPPTLVQFTASKQSQTQSGVSLFDPYSCQAVRLTVDEVTLLQLFRESSDLSTKAAIIHYASVQVRDLALIRQLMECLCADPMHFDVVELLEEYLAGSTYCLLSKQVERTMLRYLSYSSKQPSLFKGQVFCQENEARICSISYSKTYDVSLEKSTRSFTADSFWNILQMHLNDRQWSNNCRFDLQGVKYQLQTTAGPTNALQANPQSESRSFFQRMGSSIKGAASKSTRSTSDHQSHLNLPRPVRPPSRIDIILGKLPLFLKRDEEQLNNMRYNSKMVELLSVHFLNFLTEESRTKIRNISEECVRCQIQACRMLCHIVWSILGSEHCEERLLTEKADSLEKDLHALYEKIYMAAQQLSFPLPTGFDRFFIRLGFRCQMKLDFLQYLECDIYSLSSNIVLDFLHELSDSESNVKLKWQLIRKLPKDNAYECLRHWKHSEAQQCVVENYAALLTEQKNVSKSVVKKTKSPKQRSIDTKTVGSEKPLVPSMQSFVKFIEQKDDSEMARDFDHAGVDLDFLKKAAVTYFS